MLPKQLRPLLEHELNPFERFTDLLTGKDDRQDMTNMLLYYLLQAMVGEEPVAPSPGEPFPTSMGVAIPLRIRQVDIMKGIAALTTDEINPQRMADCRQALRMVLVVNNTFDQQVSVAIIGNGSDASDSAFVIHTMDVASGDWGAYGIKNEEWMPFLAVKVTPAVAPSSGTISAAAILQEQAVSK